MTMETVVDSQRDGGVNDAVSEGEPIKLKNQSSHSPSSTAAQVSVAGSPTVTVVQLPSGQTVHVQGVIQAPQASVIQSPQIQTVQVPISFIIPTPITMSIEVITIDQRTVTYQVVSMPGDGTYLFHSLCYILHSHIRLTLDMRRKIVSYVLNDWDRFKVWTDDGTGDNYTTQEHYKSEMLKPFTYGSAFAITQGGAIQIANPGSDGVQGLQTLTMTNSGTSQPGATILQYAAQAGDGPQQFFVPGSQVVVQGDMPAYQIRTPTSNLPQGVVMAASPGSIHSPQQVAEEATRKRELRLLKNREAARECRRKKKEYVKCLENRVAVLENQNKTLIEELKALKDLYCHKTD
ncbi:CREM protein, partial [Polypterus senegalus]